MRGSAKSRRIWIAQKEAQWLNEMSGCYFAEGLVTVLDTRADIFCCVCGERAVAVLEQINEDEMDIEKALNVAPLCLSCYRRLCHCAQTQVKQSEV